MRAHLPSEASIHSLTGYVDAKKARPASPAENASFVYLGRLVREKGVRMLARCAAAEKLPVTFVGSGALEQEIMEANPNAVITGWRNPQQSREYLRQARALVFPSLWFETLGLVVLEAAAVGIPSIVPDTSAAREIVEDGVTGFHFRGGDESDLRSKMRQLDDPEVAARLGKAAYDRFWSSNYASLEFHAAALESIYSKMLRRTLPHLYAKFVVDQGQYEPS
jgi:glycosyltransferase involved in cell wall biosynthesis